MYNTTFCTINFTKSRPDYYADTVLVYSDTALKRVIINDFNGDKITTQYYNNNKNLLSYTTETILDSNGICISQIDYNEGRISSIETSTFANNAYSVQSIRTIESISSQNDTSYSYDTAYGSLKRYDYFGGVYLTDSTVSKYDAGHYTYQFDTVNGNYRFWTYGNPGVDTEYCEINPVTLQIVKGFTVWKDGYITISECSYNEGKPTEGIIIEGYRNNLHTEHYRYVYKYKSTGTKVNSSGNHYRHSTRSIYRFDLMGRKILYNKPAQSLQSKKLIRLLMR
jgi:hypothetical protein